MTEITPEARAARRRARLERQNEQAASDQVDGPGTLAAAVAPRDVGAIPHSTTA
jgi:hypothetical protein